MNNLIILLTSKFPMLVSAGFIARYASLHNYALPKAPGLASPSEGQMIKVSEPMRLLVLNV